MEQSPTSVADLDFAAAADKLYKEYSRKKDREFYLAKRLGGQTKVWVTKDEWASIVATRQQGLNALRALQVTEDVPPLMLHVPRKRKAPLIIETEHKAWSKAREAESKGLQLEQALKHPCASLGGLAPSALL